MAAEFAALGVQVPASPVEEMTIDIMPSAWTSLIGFLSCQTQWRVSVGMAGLIWLGLDYTAVKLVIDDMALPAGTFADIRTMEAAALPVLNEVST